ncbi:uncharacterized protein B0P05DRAFT_590717 [Gilbertella persicaria]|uniref:uncharacterized protein n=1 Tax=Gilbertella persicaria TaxID=101096 RepID=UPI00221E52DD|nr:uncharacterized protein B0P05DRAFT_590717 [Gilbertella persicaria]KAI8060610.1 hypothetical protein B0P05DRAFT_590717 [Gilbertella persicaria]
MAKQSKKQNKVTWRVPKVNKIDKYLCSIENINASSSLTTFNDGTNAVDPSLPAPLSNYELSQEIEALKERIDYCEDLIIDLCDQQEQQEQQQQKQASQEVPPYGKIVKLSLLK